MTVSRRHKRFLAWLSRRSVRKGLLVSALLFLIAWVAFFDSHSLVKRWTWHRQAVELERQNEALRAEIEALRRQLDAGLSDEAIEQLARERYGMRKPGETVYLIEEAQ